MKITLKKYLFFLNCSFKTKYCVKWDFIKSKFCNDDCFPIFLIFPVYFHKIIENIYSCEMSHFPSKKYILKSFFMCNTLFSLKSSTFKTDLTFLRVMRTLSLNFILHWFRLLFSKKHIFNIMNFVNIHFSLNIKLFHIKLRISCCSRLQFLSWQLFSP